MARKFKLKGERILIEHDRTKGEREIQRKIEGRAKMEKEKDKRVKMGFKKVWIEEDT